MYKIFIDSVIVRIDYTTNDNKLLKFNTLINQIHSLDYIYPKNGSIPAKFYKMHLTRNVNNLPLIDCISFSAEICHSYQNIYIYSTRHGIYIAFHGLVQYDRDFREEKLKLLHYLYRKYSLKLTRLDVAIDIPDSVNNVYVYNKKGSPLDYDSKSMNKAKFFIESTQCRTKQQRVLKLYQKDTQKNRSFPYATPLTRIEMSLRAAKLKNFNKEYLIKKINVEFNSYMIKYKNQTLDVDTEMINLMFDDFFKVLEHNAHNKSYSCFYRNINTVTKNMSLAYECYKKDIPKKQFIKNNNIGLTVLKTYYKYYKN